jgi:hypothetical protein
MRGCGADAAADGQSAQMHELTNASGHAESPLLKVVPVREWLSGAAISFKALMSCSSSKEHNGRSYFRKNA